MIMKFRLNKLPRHSTFDYKPRFYDPQKEERQQRMALQSEQSVEERMKSRIARGFDRSGSSQFAFRSERNAQSAASTRRLLMIIAAMFILAYFLLEANLEGILAMLK